MSRKGLGNEACPKWNPQAEFISAEEKPRFQGFAEQILHEEIGLYSSVLTRQNPDFDEGCRLCRHPQSPPVGGLFNCSCYFIICPALLSKLRQFS